jgi:ribonuclease R
MRSKKNKGGKDNSSRNDRSSSKRGASDRNSSRRDSSRKDSSRRDRERKSAKTIVLESFSSSPDTLFTTRQIFRRLGIVDQKGREHVKEILDALIKENKLLLIDGDKYQLNLRVQIITGRVDMANNKYAYIVSEDTEDDVRVFKEHLKYAMDGDTVKVEVLPTVEGGRAEGIVVEILERSREEIVGTVELSKNFGFVVPDFKKLYFDVFVGERNLNGANAGDKVLVKITEWPSSPGKNPTGEITRQENMKRR